MVKVTEKINTTINNEIHEEFFGEYEYKKDLYNFFNVLANKKDAINESYYIRESLLLTAMPWNNLKAFIQSPPLYPFIDQDIGMKTVNKSVINNTIDSIYG